MCLAFMYSRAVPRPRNPFQAAKQLYNQLYSRCVKACQHQHMQWHPPPCFAIPYFTRVLPPHSLTHDTPCTRD